MGAIKGLMGMDGGAGGTGFSGPQAGAVVNPVTAEQITNAYTGTQGSMQSQQALLNAIQAQRGIQNQSQVYNQMQAVANGQGPNPAQAMLNQATGANVANQAALMAGQRGASQNVGMIARQAGMAGANAQQQASGQAAVMQANQSLNAMNSAGAMASQMANNEIGQTNANTQAQQSEQQALINAQLGVNNANVGAASSVNNANAALATTRMGGQHGMIGGALQGAAAAIGMAGGGDAVMPANGPRSKFGQFLSNVSSNAQDNIEEMKPKTNDEQLQKGAASFVSALGGLGGGDDGSVPMAGGMNSMEMSSAPLMAAASGGLAHDYRGGGPVQAKNSAEKAVASGNSYANDKIPAVLSEHEIVIPRSVTMSSDPINGAARFVATVMAKRRRGQK